jgi:hypothetical protein
MLRRTKADVLPELPAKRRVVQQIDADEGIYSAGMAQVAVKIRHLMALGAADGPARALLREQIAQDERQATGLSKAPSVCAFVRGRLEGGEKVLLFAHHHSVFDAYRRELSDYRPAFVTGLEDAHLKDLAVEHFMRGNTDLCCVSLRAAAGLNLQRATCVVFGELVWSPAVHSQAEDRAHRIGQRDSVLCYYLVCSQGSDQDMQDALGLKVSQFRALMGEPLPPEDQEKTALAAANAISTGSLSACVCAIRTNRPPEFRRRSGSAEPPVRIRWTYAARKGVMNAGQPSSGRRHAGLIHGEPAMAFGSSGPVPGDGQHELDAVDLVDAGVAPDRSRWARCWRGDKRPVGSGWRPCPPRGWADTRRAACTRCWARLP